ncbi:F-box protein At5g07610-like [Cornus florida]|uniref:F-box protein At5g07610-like n=1 Tax=Cornus florida TaxID=4283 RepID=UPI00289F187E|nr:F-box protein At5g07610-like [Cornus florida]
MGLTIVLSELTGSTFPGDRVYLVFDPSKSLHYKFVLLQSKLYGGGYLCQMHIYSSETKAWSSPPNICDQHPFQLSICFSQLETSIYFDVDQQRWCPMPTPPYQVAVFKFWHFGKSRGHLHYINYHDDTGFNLNFYEMESDYSKWTLKYRVDLNPMVVDLAAKEEMVVRYDMVSVLSLFHGEDQGDVFLVLFVGTNMIISYNIKDNTFKKLDGHSVSSSHDLSWFKRCRVHRYIETLFPV